MTILTVTNSDGSRRCDGKCHSAVAEKCTCVCGGAFHGAARRGDLGPLVYANLLDLAEELDQAQAGSVRVIWPQVQKVLPM